MAGAISGVAVSRSPIALAVHIYLSIPVCGWIHVCAPRERVGVERNAASPTIILEASAGPTGFHKRVRGSGQGAREYGVRPEHSRCAVSRVPLSASA